MARVRLDRPDRPVGATGLISPWTPLRLSTGAWFGSMSRLHGHVHPLPPPAVCRQVHGFGALLGRFCFEEFFASSSPAGRRKSHLGPMGPGREHTTAATTPNAITSQKGQTRHPCRHPFPTRLTPRQRRGGEAKAATWEAASDSYGATLVTRKATPLVAKQNKCLGV